MQEQPAVPSCTSSENELKRQLGRALLHFQDRLLESDITPGSLCQVWMPGVSGEGDQVLRAKGQPYCAAGIVDLLALFRCISCRYCFSTDLTKPTLLGAPGRVFTSRQPEMTRNVQHQSKDVYLRAQEAMHCRVHSTLVLPLYRTAERETVAGVLEVIQTSEDMVFAQLVDILSEELERCNLYTVDDLQRDQLRKKAPELLAASASTSKGDNSTHVSVSQNGSSFGSPVSIRKVAAAESGFPEGVDETSNHLPTALCPCLPELGDSSIRGGTIGATRGFIQAHPMVTQPELGIQMRGSSEAAAALQLAQAPSFGMVTRHSEQVKAAKSFIPTKSVDRTDSKTSSYFDDEEIGSEDGWDDDLEDSAEGVGDDASRANRRRGKGTGNPGKPGKKLRLADLQSQFGVGLKEAANKLGICPTTLKRACRRHGIQRWPRRQLARLTRAIDQIRSSGGNGVPVVDRPLRSSSRGKASSDEQVLLTSPTGSYGSLPSASGGLCHSEPALDTRWTTLDQLEPGFNHNSSTDDACAPGQDKRPSLVAQHEQGHPRQKEPMPYLIPSQRHDSPNASLSFSPALMSEVHQTEADFATQLSMPSLAADAWAVQLKDDPWAESAKTADPSIHTHTMQLDGNNSCCMSLGDTIACGRAHEEESVHGANAFQASLSAHASTPGLLFHSLSGRPPLHDSHFTETFFNQEAMNIPTTTALRSSSSAHCLAASHNPGLEDGMLAQSLQSAVPQGICRLPQSLPNMLSGAYTQANLRHSLAVQMGSGTIAHGMSQSNLHHAMLLQREHNVQQEGLDGLDAQCGAFAAMHKEQLQQLGAAHGLQSCQGEDAEMAEGVEGDILEMLIPEEA